MVCVLLAALLAGSGCAVPETARSEPTTPTATEATFGKAEFTYSISISAPPLRISDGNLHWHKKLPNNTYTLEDMAIEIANFGDFDILVSRLEIRIDGDSRLFDVDMVIPGATSQSLVIQPMMTGYDGGTYTVYVASLDEGGAVLCESAGHEIGPLEPVAGTGIWNQLPD
ncbi:hypothetical protein ACFLS8_05865 [Chloroflexota bacterium]